MIRMYIMGYFAFQLHAAHILFPILHVNQFQFEIYYVRAY